MIKVALEAINLQA